MSVPDKMPIEEAKRLAAEWGVTSRTIYNWKRAGVDFTDKLAVCDHIASLRNPSHAALRAALAVLNPEQDPTA
jgi:hypothetical protein